jgi:hypothetical protein
MRVLIVIYFFMLLVVAGCGKPSEGKPEWWLDMLTQDKTPLRTVVLKPGAEIIVDIDAIGEQRLGLLIKQADELRQAPVDRQLVILKQQATGKYVETYYSASDLFNLSLGRSFIVRNRSQISVDAVLYRVRQNNK